MRKNKTEKIQNETFITTQEFINFKKEIKKEINNIKNNNELLDNKLDTISDNLNSIQTNTNNQFVNILDEMKKSLIII